MLDGARHDRGGVQRPRDVGCIPVAADLVATLNVGENGVALAELMILELLAPLKWNPISFGTITTLPGS